MASKEQNYIIQRVRINLFKFNEHENSDTETSKDLIFHFVYKGFRYFIQNMGALERSVYRRRLESRVRHLKWNFRYCMSILYLSRSSESRRFLHFWFELDSQRGARPLPKSDPSLIPRSRRTYPLFYIEIETLT